MPMKAPVHVLRIFMGDLDKISSVPVFEKIITEAKNHGLAGAIVFRSIMGFGGTGRKIHAAKLFRRSENLPIVIEIADEKEKIDGFLPFIDAIFIKANCGGLLTIEKVEVIQYALKK